MIALLTALVLLGEPSSLEAAELEAVKLPHADGLARIAQWAAAHPDDPELPRAWLWQAQVLMADRRTAEARSLLESVAAFPGAGDLAWDARLALADLLALEHRFADAERAYATLGAPAGSRWEYQAQLRAVEAREEARRRWAVLGAAIALGLLLGFRAVRAGRQLWPPPEEWLWAAPLLGLVAVAGLTRPEGERFAVCGLALGGMALLWVNGAFLRRATLSGPRRGLEALLGVAQAAALLFCVVVWGGLWARLLDTLAGGVE